MTARPAYAWSVLWADCRLPGVVFTIYRDAQEHARKLQRAGTAAVRIARIEIREIAA